MEKEDYIKNIGFLLESLEKKTETEVNQETMKKEQQTLVKQMVVQFDYVLKDKLRLDLQKNIKKEENHYWTYLSKYYQIPSVKFCTIYHKNNNLKELGMIWILLSILEKSFNDSINQIYIQNFDKKFYDKASIIVVRKKDILNLCQRLNAIALVDFKSEIQTEYKKYKASLKLQKEADDMFELISPIMRQPNEKNIYISNYNLEPISKVQTNNLNSMFFSSATVDLQQQFNEGNEKGMESFFNLIENDENDVVVENEENMNSNNTNNNVNGSDYISQSRTLGPNKKKIADGKPIFSKFASVKKSYFVTKNCDFLSSLKDNFYTFTEKIKKQMTFSKKKQDIFMIINNENHQLKSDLILNPQRKRYFPIDKFFKATRRADRTLFTKKDLILYKGKEVKLTNSILFYLNNFYHKEPYIKFRTKKSSLKPITIESQNYQCDICHKKFKTLLSIPTETIYWCSYYMRFVCQDCISEDYSFIPDFILRGWSFKKFSISKEAKKLLARWYNKPVIYIKQNDPLIKKSTSLLTAMIIKRKIHKIFDLMKCPQMNEFVNKTLGEYRYLVLHENLFSLQDLVEIYEETFFDKLNGFYNKMKTHILKDCDVCLYKGGKCIMCLSDEIIYAFDVESVVYCNDCKKMFHKKCCTVVHPCIINR